MAQEYCSFVIHVPSRIMNGQMIDHEDLGTPSRYLQYLLRRRTLGVSHIVSFWTDGSDTITLGA